MKVESIELSNFTISVQNIVRFIPSTAIETQSQDGFQKKMVGCGGQIGSRTWEGVGFLPRLVLTLGSLGQKVHCL